MRPLDLAGWAAAIAVVSAMAGTPDLYVGAFVVVGVLLAVAAWRSKR